MGFKGHWTSTRDGKRGVKIWVDGRPMFAVIAGLEDCKTTEGGESTWSECVTELLKRMNEDR